MAGWVSSKKVVFTDVQYCIYADILDKWVRKGPKMC